MNPKLSLQLHAARTLLSSMPDDVFNIYIAPLIESHGWPFNIHGAIIDPVEAKRWHQMFDLQSVEAIRQLSWERHALSFSLGLFHPRSQRVITMLIEHHGNYAFHAGIANVANSRIKLFRARDYIARTGQLPAPVILQNDWEGLRILDGNHRIAALVTFGDDTNGAPLDAWIGMPTLGKI